MRRRSLSVAAAVCLTLLAAAMMAIPASAVQVRETVQVDHMYNSWGATRFYDGLAGVTDRGAGVRKYGFIDTNGELVIPFQYQYASDFSEGLARVQDSTSGLYGFVDQTEAEVIPCQYTIVLGFSEGLAAAYTPVNGLWGFIDKGGYIDKAGNVVVSFQYEWAGSFSDGYALAKKELPEDDLVILHIEEGPAPRAVAVNKTDNGDVSVSASQASGGETVTVTVTPDSGYALETVTVLDKDGKAFALTDKGGGRYTFTMPDCDVAVRAAFRKNSAFRDVAAGAYYREAVEWAVEKGITSGVGNGLFGSSDPCTRAQIVTFLWRAAGSPEPKALSSFTDVPADAWYAKAVAWAVENGVTAGVGDGLFGSDDTCTRAQSVTFLFKALKAAAKGQADFKDVSASDWYAKAVAWAVENGVTAGVGGGLFGSGDDCTRAQIVTFLFKAYQGK